MPSPAAPAAPLLPARAAACLLIAALAAAAGAPQDAGASAREERGVSADQGPIRALDVIETGDNPTGISFTPDGHSALVACMDASRVDVLDVASRTRRQSVRVGLSPSGLVVRADGSAWVGDIESDRLELLVPDGTGAGARWELVPQAGVEVGDHVALASEPDGWGRVHVPVFTRGVFFGGALVALDPEAGEVLGQREVPSVPIQAVVGPDGAQLACSTYVGGDLLAWELFGGEPLGALDLDEQPAGLAFTPDGAQVLCAVRGEDRVAVVDAWAWDEVTTIDEQVGPEPIAVAVGGPWAFVLNHEAGDVSVLDTRARPWRVVQRVAVGDKPWFARAHPTRRELWVACKGDEQVHVLGWDAPVPRPAELVVLGTRGARHLVGAPQDEQTLASRVRALAPDALLVQVAAGVLGAHGGVHPRPAWLAPVQQAAEALGVPLVPVGDWTPWAAAHAEAARAALVRDPGQQAARDALRAGEADWQDLVALGPAHPAAVGARLVARVRTQLADGVRGPRVLLVVEERHVQDVVAGLRGAPDLAVRIAPAR